VAILIEKLVDQLPPASPPITFRHHLSNPLKVKSVINELWRDTVACPEGLLEEPGGPREAKRGLDGYLIQRLLQSTYTFTTDILQIGTHALLR
jgi:hypothetical protein